MRFLKFSVPAVCYALVITSNANPPTWWGEGSASAIAPAAPSNNQGPVSVAQAKWMAFRALGKLQTVDPILANAIFSKLTQPQPKAGGGYYPATLDFTTLQPLPFGWTASQRSPLLLGQLKAIAAPFYDLLQAKDPAWLSAQLDLNLTKDSAYPANFYPWSSSPADDANRSPATVGQLKSVLSLRFETLSGVPTGGSLDTDGDGLNNLAEYNAGTNSWTSDTDGDGLPDKWELDHSINPINGTGANGASGDQDSDGYTNIREYYLNSNPSISSSTPVGMVIAKEHRTHALTADGRVWSWGYNGSGELGDGTQINRNSPVPLANQAGMAKIIQIDAGRNFSFALDENGALWAWGYNGNRQISKDATYQYLAPFKIEMPVPVERFACGGDHVIVMDRTGALWSWGSNGSGQLGLGHTNPVVGIAQITKPLGMGNITSLAASAESSHAVDAAGKIWSWGYNGYGQLGDGSSMNRSSPVAVDVTTGIPAVRSVTAGGYHTMAAAVDGSIWAWGYNGYGQLGNGSYSSNNKPVKLVAGLTLASALGTGSYHSLAVAPSGEVWSWGYNGNGQLGINSTTSVNSPVQTTAVASWSSILQVSAGYSHSVAMKSDGSLWTWGYNNYGQLGFGDLTQRPIATQLTTLKLANDDSDADGLPDSWERYYFGNLLQSGTGIYVANGITNLVAYSKGVNPTVLDNDNDGISDAVEITAGLEPLDWSDATGDLDGDRISNLWELNMGTSMTDSVSKPVVTATVSSGQSIQSAINAVAGNSSNPPWIIIQVQPGVYSENITLPSDKRILLIPASNSGIPEIRGAYTSATVNVYGEGVIDGFRITHAKGVAGYGVLASMSNGRALARIVNCMVHGHTGSNGNGIYESSGRLVIAHCSVFRNSASGQGNGLYVGGGARTLLVNSIFWNPTGQAAEEVYSYGITQCRQTFIRDGSLGGALTTDPRINPLGFLIQSSSARSKGIARALAFRDIHDEIRGAQPDIGADQFADTDKDGLPDWLELLGVTSTTADNDGDSITNLNEYEINGTNPLGADTDGDGLNDGAELVAGADPLNSDSDGDTMPDGWEVQYGLNPTNDKDLLEDADRDRVPNVYEFANGTLPNLATSLPAPHITVDPAVVTETSVLKRTIQNAIYEPLNINRHTIIRVKLGTYPESLNIDSRRIVLLGDLGTNLPVIAPASGNAVRIYENSAVLDGFLIRRGATTSTDRGLYLYTDLDRDQARIVNCTISGFSAYSGSAAYLGKGRLTVAHCTIMDNSATANGRAFELYTGCLILQNSIVWNPTGPATQQIYQYTPGTATATNSIILGGELGSISTAPMTDRYYALMPSSPALGAGTPLPVSSMDRHGELRPPLAPDIGADQRLDSDSDSLPDWWENFYFGNLTKSATGDNDSPSLDRLTNDVEYQLGFDPTKPDTLGNLRGDLFNAVFGSTGDAWYPADWRLDSDFDGLTNGEELYYGTTPLNADTNRDGISDLMAIFVGFSPTVNDTDGDGILNAAEIEIGTNPLFTDSDGDGVNDGTDNFPLDPTRWDMPIGSAGDVTPPVITLIEPVGAVLVP